MAYLSLAALVLGYWRRRALPGVMLSVSCVASGLWAVFSAYDYAHAFALAPLTQVLEIARSCCWAALVLGLLYWIKPVGRTTIAAALLVLCAILSGLVLASFGLSPIPPDLLELLLLGGHLALCLVGLVLVEDLFRHSTPERRWTVKYLCLGTGILFAYDFYLYSDALLFNHASRDLVAARGLINLLAVPLFGLYAARERAAGPDIAISRRFAFYSASVFAAGLYLMTMAAAGYYIRIFGGTWSVFLEAVFFCCALLLLLPLSSGTFRARLRIFIEKSFFKYKYDYRAEWLRFSQAMSSPAPGVGLSARVIEAVGNIVESPEGGLWLPNESGRFALAGEWNLSRWKLARADATIPAESPLARFLAERQWVIDLVEYAAHPDRYPGLMALPDWLRGSARAWLVLPLANRKQLLGMMMLGHPRAAHELTWEDFDLLKTVAQQVASYLAEEAASEALEAARQFDAFNKRFAFVVHDIKNLASQLSLILANAAKFRGNARFQDDMIETVHEAVEKMNRMLRQLHAAPEEAAPVRIELAPLLEKIVAVQNGIGARVSFEPREHGLAVAADEDRLKAVVEQLVQNAVDAVGRYGEVQV
ncbi:MAG: XrtA/PEP-CTERM system histidine kinase PrsK, partial [Stellaceae bacterium]